MAICARCSAEFERRKPSRGRPRLYCYSCQPFTVSNGRNAYIRKTTNCVGCGGSLPGRRTKWCSRWCQDRNKPDGRAKKISELPPRPCLNCGRLMVGRRRKYCDKACRDRSRMQECVDCGAACWANRCKPCDDKSRLIRSEDDPHTLRLRREQAAPGLTSTQRSRLLHKWVRQQRTCTYCNRPATTVDHIVPLVRGGTNREGNLAPCCRSCNGSKSGFMVIEWRHKKRLAQATKPLAWSMAAA